MTFTDQEIQDAVDTYMLHLVFVLHRTDPRYATVAAYFNNRENIVLQIQKVTTWEYNYYFYQK